MKLEDKSTKGNYILLILWLCKIVEKQRNTSSFNLIFPNFFMSFVQFFLGFSVGKLIGTQSINQKEGYMEDITEQYKYPEGTWFGFYRI